VGKAMANIPDADKEALLEKLRAILNGIDHTETDHPEGWWETSTGADFGRERLKLIEQFVREA
jgi:hypothetical protein